MDRWGNDLQAEQRTDADTTHTPVYSLCTELPRKLTKSANTSFSLTSDACYEKPNCDAWLKISCALQLKYYMTQCSLTSVEKKNLLSVRNTDPLISITTYDHQPAVPNLIPLQFLITNFFNRTSIALNSSQRHFCLSSDLGETKGQNHIMIFQIYFYKNTRHRKSKMRKVPSVIVAIPHCYCPVQEYGFVSYS
jgi:hypothetical protein